jgi:hypothetical protein
MAKTLRLNHLRLTFGRNRPADRRLLLHFNIMPDAGERSGVTKKEPLRSTQWLGIKREGDN